MDRLLHSAKFLTAVVDAVFSTVVLLATRFMSPNDVDLILKLIAIYQPVFILVIGGIAYEDGKAAALRVAQAEAKAVAMFGGIATNSAPK